MLAEHADAGRHGHDRNEVVDQRQEGRTGYRNDAKEDETRRCRRVRRRLPAPSERPRRQTKELSLTKRHALNYDRRVSKGSPGLEVVVNPLVHFNCAAQSHKRCLARPHPVNVLDLH